jgi:glycosyltransferase involved in cell wall biosynthesis
MRSNGFHAGVSVHRVWMTSLGYRGLWGRALDYLTFHVNVIWRVRRLARKGDVVIACTDPPLLSVTVMLATLGTGAVLVNWLHDLYPEVAIQLGVLDERRLMVRLLLWLRNASLRRARRNVTPIPRMAEFLSAHGISYGSFAVIRQWADGTAIHPVEPAMNRLRREWCLQDKFVVGYSGNFGRVHDFNTILDAAERLRDRRDIVFLFVGDGPRKSAVEHEVRRRGLGNVVLKPLQPREGLAETLSVADVHLVSLLPELENCCVPSKFYGILAVGRPILFIGDTSGELGQTIRDTRCGASVDVGDGARLAQVICQFAECEVERREMGIRARQTFESAFSESIGVGTWHQLLKEVCPPSRIAVRPMPDDEAMEARRQAWEQ